jgi:release factor glutamine methyltransferase
MRLSDVLWRGTQTLSAAGVAEPRREARTLLRHALGVSDRATLNPAAEIDPAAFDALLARRAAREPMAFLRGRQGFWTLDLQVSPATLIPRPDSETLISAALAAFPDRSGVRRILDLGTGTGALLLAALAEFPQATGVGIDLVPAAAALGARNARANGMDGRAMFLAGCWAAPIAGRFDLVLANPPYIPSAEVARLMPEVAAHEPRTALDGGADGLDAIRAILPALAGLLESGGAAIVEIGAGQADAAVRLAITAGFSQRALHNDLGGIARALVLRDPVAKKSFGTLLPGG